MLTAICFKHQIAHIAANHDRPRRAFVFGRNVRALASDQLSDTERPSIEFTPL
jgi:hypothetical protein